MVVQTFEEVLLFFDRCRREGIPVEPQKYAIGEVYNYKDTPIALEVSITMTRLELTLTYYIDICSISLSAMQNKLYTYGSVPVASDIVAAEFSMYCVKEDKQGLLLMIHYLFEVALFMKHYASTLEEVKDFKRACINEFYESKDSTHHDFADMVMYLLDKEEETITTTSPNTRVATLAQRL